MVDTSKKDLGPKRVMPAADFSLLAPEDMEALRKEARASILEEMKQAARDKFFENEREKLRREKVPADTLVDIEINSAPYVPYFMLDGKSFYNGYTYKIPSKVAAVLYEQMQRSWRHQDEIDGRSRVENLARNIRIGLRDAGTVTRGFAPGSVINADMS